MTTFKITVAYDGTDYVGWQRQASGVSIPGLLEDALRALDERDVPVAAAGRTDAGVHALGQVASFTLARALPCDAIVRAVNARLPDAVPATRVEDVRARLRQLEERAARLEERVTADAFALNRRFRQKLDES